MRIGIFGGTFNPIHRCHLQIARSVRNRIRLDRIFFVPSGYPPHKVARRIESSRDRLAMVRRAIAGEPRFSLSREEVNRSGKSYAIETVANFKKRYPAAEIFYILGLDAFVEIGSWRSPRHLLSLCHFIVVSRSGFSFRMLKKLALPIPWKDSVLKGMDQGRLREAEVPLPGGRRLFLLRLPPCESSSTEIRERLRTGKRLKKFLPEPVKSYIMKKGLYQ